jgi:hypothetical protein
MRGRRATSVDTNKRRACDMAWHDPQVQDADPSVRRRKHADAEAPASPSVHAPPPETSAQVRPVRLVGSLLGSYWVAIGSLLGRYWVASWSLLAHYWVAVGSLLSRYWVAIGSLLGRSWVAIGSLALLGHDWVAIGSLALLGRYWVAVRVPPPPSSLYLPRVMTAPFSIPSSSAVS